ncbi:MAG TPA: DUF3883 domain-containing protein [Cyclobacteriaceae bacterium]|nr:DUF3883 domain-containing protein [Cyclobacteriaceae bacterium]
MEKYLKQAYEGRYLFELIQNARDANRVSNSEGEIYIVLKDKVLSVSNTGAPFTEQGIEGITTIGQSTKASQDFIGFKGIGFKSVQEVTNTPRIVTSYGTIVFDRELTLNRYQRKVKEHQLPLFYFPHFDHQKLTKEEEDGGIVTRINLPIKDSIDENDIVDAMEKLDARQLILMGNVRMLSFHSAEKSISFNISHEQSRNRITVVKNEEEISRFKSFTTSRANAIPQEVIEQLEGREKEVFEQSNTVDISIVFALNERGNIILSDRSKLYLFYPLEITSGFRFIIHSYFVVNPERKALRDSRVNDFLLDEVAKFLSSEVLVKLRASNSNTTTIFTFVRNPDAKLDPLYDSLVELLSTQKFIYDSQTRRYFSPEEVVVADGFDRGLFPNGQLGEKQLVYTEDEVTRDWLQKEFGVEYLSYERIAEEIEAECVRQLKVRNVRFFQTLYNYVIKHHRIDLSGRKILLTQQMTLVSGEDDVFYRGKGTIDLSNKIGKYIQFIHPEIKISDLREGRSRTGILEFNTFELTRRLLKLYKMEDVPRHDILNALFQLELDGKSELEIKEKVFLPVEGGHWLRPLVNPIYIPSPELRALYPNGNFIDYTFFDSKDLSVVHLFLKLCGVWDIPAVYISDAIVRVRPNENREGLIQKISSLYSRPFQIKNDRFMDKPVEYNAWFTQKIIENWDRYNSFVCADVVPFQYTSHHGTSYRRPGSEDTVMQLTSFHEFMMKEPWIFISSSTINVTSDSVVGMDPTDYMQAHNQIVKRNLKVLSVSYPRSKRLIDSLQIIHLDGDNIEDYVSLLENFHRQFANSKIDKKELSDLYGRLLGKLFEFYYFRKNQGVDISLLKDVMFLSVNEVTGEYLWEKAGNIYHLDRKISYDMLPTSVKVKLQPQFTVRDKGTFGKIAAKIGRSISSSVRKELLPGVKSTSAGLPLLLKELPECLAIVENFLDVVFSRQQLELMKDIMVFESSEVRVKISIDQNYTTDIMSTYYVDEDDSYNIHIVKDTLVNRNKVLADALCEVLVKLLDRDLKKLNTEIFRYLGSDDKISYLKDFEISDDRLADIKNQIYSRMLSPIQFFWDAVLYSKGITDRAIFQDDNVDLNELAKLLLVPRGDLQEFDNDFDYTSTSQPSNRLHLVNLMNTASLSLELLNEYLSPRISFAFFFEAQLVQLKNRYQSKFETVVYNFLKKKSISDQQELPRYMDRYDAITFRIPENALDLDILFFFVNSLKEFFPDIHDVDQIIKIKATIDLKNYFVRNLSAFKKAIGNVSHSDPDVDLFFSDYKRRSLMYFGHVEALVADFRAWLELKQTKTRISLPSSENPNETLNGEIPDVIISSADMERKPSNVLQRKGAGRRFDGSANDELKSKIGMISERLVFELLSKKYRSVKWVSKNASKVDYNHLGFNPEGDDSLGYDLFYIDENQFKFYVEVKGRADNSNSFEITRRELDFGSANAEFYKVILVNYALDDRNRRFRNLGCLFKYKDGEDFFNNTKFLANYRTFEIQFK